MTTHYTTCDECGATHEGLLYFVPDDAWRAVSEHNDSRGVLCPWCLNAKLKKADIHASIEITFNLSHLHGVNMKVIEQLEMVGA